MTGRIYTSREAYLEFGNYKVTDYSNIATAIRYIPITPSGSIVLSTDSTTIVKPANVKAELHITIASTSMNNTILALLEKSKRLVTTPNGLVLPSLSGIISGAVDSLAMSILSTSNSDIFHTGTAWIFKNRSAFDVPKTDVEQLGRTWVFEFAENDSTLLGAFGYAA